MYMLGALVFLGACSASLDQAKVRSQINQSGVSQKMGDTAGLSSKLDAGDYAFPVGLCYVVHVTGGTYTQGGPDDDLCGPASGAGQLKGSVRQGDEIAFEVQIGTNLNFEVVGFEVPAIAKDATGRPVECPAAALLLRDPSLKPRAQVTLGGAVYEHGALFAQGSAAIKPGDNLVTLYKIPSELGKTIPGFPYSFGLSWTRLDQRDIGVTCTDPAAFARDSDGDGLSDGEEARLGTNPLLADTDGDGLSDYMEVKVFGTDPKNADTDGDGLTDALELATGVTDTYDTLTATNPLDADSDDDGLRDGDEVLATGPVTGGKSLNPLKKDTDGDGLWDGLELGLTLGVLSGKEVRGV